jgi:hypothetical protein
MDCGGVHGRGDGDDPVEVVVLQQDDHDLERSVNHRCPLLQVLGLDNQLFDVQGELKGRGHYFSKMLVWLEPVL